MFADIQLLQMVVAKCREDIHIFGRVNFLYGSFLTSEDLTSKEYMKPRVKIRLPGKSFV